jgi:hypothetical protein
MFAKSAVFIGPLTICPVKALVVGHAEPAAALTSALSDRGIDAELHAPARAAGGRAIEALAAALIELEARLEAERPRLAIAVGTGDAPLALAISAAKLGVPVVAWVEDPGRAAEELDRAEERILRVLADMDAGPIGDGVAAFEAAERISSWAHLNLDGS